MCLALPYTPIHCLSIALLRGCPPEAGAEYFLGVILVRFLSVAEPIRGVWPRVCRCPDLCGKRSKQAFSLLAVPLYWRPCPRSPY